MCVDDKTDSNSKWVKKLIVWLCCPVENKKGMKWKMGKLKGRFGAYRLFGAHRFIYSIKVKT